MTDWPKDVEFLGGISFGELVVDPQPERTRIEIVMDELGREARIDYEADMAYVRVREGKHHRCDIKLEDRSLITDYDERGNLLGVEIFMVNAAIREETVKALTRLLRSPYAPSSSVRGGPVGRWFDRLRQRVRRYARLARSARVRSRRSR